jgi:ABC-type glycerol-3-phosphate transport system substrate-binding protein
MRSHFHHRAGALLAAALLIAGCGGSGGGASAPPAAPPPVGPAPPPAPEPTSFTSFVRTQLTETEAAPEAASINEQEWAIDDEETSFDDLIGASGGG